MAKVVALAVGVAVAVMVARAVAVEVVVLVARAVARAVVVAWVVRGRWPLQSRWQWR